MGNDTNLAPVGSSYQKRVTAREAELAEIRRLRSTNPIYDEYLEEWNFYLSAYVGGKDFAKEDNLFRHPREHEDDYKERVKRLHYLNYCEPLVEFFTDFIFAETIQRDGGSSSDFYNTFLNDVNKKDEDITTFMEQISDDMQIFGMVYILVEAPDKGDKKLTKAQEQQLGIRPYWVEVRPDEVLDWVSDPFDRFLYLKRQQDVEEFNGTDRVILERYTEWTQDIIRITDVDVTKPEQPIIRSTVVRVNKLKVVPFVPVRYKRSKKYRFMADSFIRDLSYNNREVMNLTSLEQEFLYRQCFNILAMQKDDSIPKAQQQEGEIGTSNVMEYPKGANAPQYIAPDVDAAKFIMEERQRLVQEMYKRAAQDMVNELFNGGKASGFSKAQSFSTTVPKIASRAEILEKAENRCMALTMQYMGKKWDGKVKYKDRYEITNITDALSHLTSLFKDLQVKSKTLLTEEMKRMVHEIDGKIPPDKLALIYREIENQDFTDYFETMKLALIGTAGQPPQDGTGGGTGKPVPGKETPPKASTPKRAQSTTAEIVAESTKKKKKSGSN